MEYRIQIDDEQAFNWLRTLLENTIHSDTPAAFVSYPHLAAWIDAFDNAEVKRKNGADFKKMDKPIPKSTDKPDRPVKKKTTPAKKDSSANVRQGSLDRTGLACTVHKTYQGKRVPRLDCKGCWALYKKFHPMEYKVKRRTFLTKQRQKES